jgi:peptidyl-prolyl cis-trans isomerase D
MDSLRNFLTGPRLFIVIASCALPFVFLGTSSLGSNFQDSLGSINGENISQEDFKIASNITIQKFKNIYGDDFDFNELDQEIQFEQIKQELILQKVLLSEARNLGLINQESEKESKKSIIKNPAFQVNGIFNEGIYEAQVNAGGYTKESYIDLMTNMLAAEQYRFLLSSSNFVTEAEVKELASLFEQSLDINFIKIDLESLKAQINNLENEIQDFYNENQIRFYSNEKRTIDYFILSAADYENLVEVPSGYVEKAYDEYVNKVNQRNQIRFSHVMVNKENYDNDGGSLNQIKFIMSELDKGTNFAEVVKKYSDDIVTRDNGGDLEYLDIDVFPVEFSNALSGLDINETSSIIELDETYHILKVTEVNKVDVLSLNEKKNDILNELITAESLALMSDDYNKIDEMIFTEMSIKSIASDFSKEIMQSIDLENDKYNFDVEDTRVKDFIFSPNTAIGSTTIISLQDSIIVLSLADIKEPSLKSFKNVSDQANIYLTESKAIDKKTLLSSELKLAKDNGSIEEFLSAYNFISQDSFIGVKRFSSLLPQDVITEIFMANEGDSISVDSSNGDKYILDLLKINRPSEESIDELFNQYKNFSDEKIAKSFSEMINEDVFNSAKVNLTNISF